MDIFNLIALTGTRKVLFALQQGRKVRYSDLVKAVGHSTTTTRALGNMEKLDLVRREVLQEKYRPVVYSLTAKGEKLAEILKELKKLEDTLKTAD